MKVEPPEVQLPSWQGSCLLLVFLGTLGVLPGTCGFIHLGPLFPPQFLCPKPFPLLSRHPDFAHFTPSLLGVSFFTNKSPGMYFSDTFVSLVQSPALSECARYLTVVTIISPMSYSSRRGVCVHGEGREVQDSLWMSGLRLFHKHWTPFWGVTPTPEFLRFCLVA
jgi:hypothetical protein